MTARLIPIAAALLLRPDGRTLLVRKRGTAFFMQPGGKLMPGETASAALLRELDEEIGLRIAPDQLSPLGDHEAEAANEPGWRVRATLFLVRTTQSPHPAAEIDRMEWVDPADPVALMLAPLTRDHVLPLAVSIAASNRHLPDANGPR